MRKKQLSYNDMTKMIQDMQEQQLRERNRMAQVMAAGLLNGNAAARLGDCSDADLRRIVAYMAEDIDRYMDRLEAEKEAKNEARAARKTEQDQPQPEAVPQDGDMDWR